MVTGQGGDLGMLEMVEMSPEWELKALLLHSPSAPMLAVTDDDDDGLKQVPEYVLAPPSLSSMH